MEITDEYILEKYYNTSLQWRWIKDDNIMQYLKNRFNDIDETDTVSQILYRIKHGLEERPKYKVCGKNAKYLLGFDGYSDFCGCRECRLSEVGQKIIQRKNKQTCLEKYGVEYSFQSENNKMKSKQTCLEKYGVEYVSQNVEIRNKQKQTCLEKYGVENACQAPEVVKKRKETMIQRYGVDYIFKDHNKIKEIIQKRDKTVLEKYGVKNIGQLQFVKDKIKNTLLNKYGYEYLAQIPEIQEKCKQSQQYRSQQCWTTEAREKRYNTFKEHNTFNKSTIEQQFYDYIITIFPNVQTQYKNEIYSYACDFYIEDIDLYIEINGTWTHGPHPYNENNKDDIGLLNKWKSKNTKYYNNAIYTWTQLDVKKQQIATDNNLNYLVIYEYKLEKCINEFIKYMEQNFPVYIQKVDFK